MFDLWNADDFFSWKPEADGSSLTRKGALNETGFYRYAASEVNGPSDMFVRVRLRFKDGSLLTDHEIRRVWLALRLRHPLLDTTFLYNEGGENGATARELPLDIVYRHQGAEERAESALAIVTLQDESELDWARRRNELTNGERRIADTRVARLVVYRTTDGSVADFVFLLAHAIADGVSSIVLQKDLVDLVTGAANCEIPSRAWTEGRLPPGLEGCLPHTRPAGAIAPHRPKKSAKQRWHEAFQYALWEVRTARRPSPPMHWPFWQAVPETRQSIRRFDVAQSKRIIRACKAHGVTVGHLIYAAATAAFTNISIDLAEGRLTDDTIDLQLPRPLGATSGITTFAVGTPMNARGYLRRPWRTNSAESRRSDLWMTLAFLDLPVPCVEVRRDTASTGTRMWALAKVAKRLTRAATNDKHFADQMYITQERRLRRIFPKGSVQEAESKSAGEGNRPDNNRAEQTETRVLGTPGISFGASSIGAIDRTVYVDKAAPRQVEIEAINMGMRVRAGELLMHSYSFNGQLHLSLMHDARLGEKRTKAWQEEAALLMLAAVDAAPGTSPHL
ncbi:hypothetical protein PYCC9005_002677 [Savitreella phatthalungensis]